MLVHVFHRRTRFFSPGSSVTPTCWRPAWCSARPASCGCWRPSWPTVSRNALPFTARWFYLPSKLHAYLSGLNNLGVQIILRFSLQALQMPYLRFSPMEWVNPWSPTCCTASWRRWITCIGWATFTGQWTRSTSFLLMFVNVSMSWCCPVSGVKASHILLSEEGRVYLSGLHSVYSMMRDGKRMRAVFDMPHHSPALLPWLSPELLRQVRTHPVKIFTLL